MARRFQQYDKRKKDKDNHYYGLIEGSDSEDEEGEGDEGDDINIPEAAPVSSTFL